MSNKKIPKKDKALSEAAQKLVQDLSANAEKEHRKGGLIPPDNYKPPAVPVQLFIFRVWVTGEWGTVQDYLLSFAHSNNWRREILIRQVARLFPEARSFKLDDGTMEIEFDNNPQDIDSVIEKLENPTPADIEESENS